MPFTKVLVAEDSDSENYGVVARLKNLGFETIHYSQYCNDALLKVKKALFDEQPYQLLVSDLSFNDPNHKSSLDSGEALIAAARNIQPDLKVIVFSFHQKRTTIHTLLEEQKVDAYVCKGLNGLKELQRAIEQVAEGQQYLCPVAAAVLQQKNVLELSDYEQRLLRLLANGYKQSKISHEFKETGVSPNSIRSVEAHISKLKDIFNANNTQQLVYMAANLGLI